MSCSRSHLYESLNTEDSTEPAQERMQAARMMRFLGEYFEGGGHGYPIDRNHCKNCFDIYDTIVSIETKYK